MFMLRYVRSPLNEACGPPVKVAMLSEVATVERATAQIGMELGEEISLGIGLARLTAWPMKIIRAK